MASQQQHKGGPDAGSGSSQQDRKAPETASSSDAAPSAQLQENVPPGDLSPGSIAGHVASRRRSATGAPAPPTLRSGSTISGAPTTNETSTSSTESLAPETQLPESTPAAESSDSVRHSQEDESGGALTAERHSSTVREPSPRTIEAQLKRVEKHTRKTSGETGFVKPKPDPNAPPKPIDRTISGNLYRPLANPPPVLREDIPEKLWRSDETDDTQEAIPHDLTYQRVSGVQIRDDGLGDLDYYVSDPVIFERWLATYGFQPDERPDLRLGSIQHIVPYGGDDPGPEMGCNLHGEIGIKVRNACSERPTYKIVDEDDFAKFLEPEGWRLSDFPPIRTVRGRPGIHFNDWTDTKFLDNGVLLFDSDARANRYYTVSNEQVFQAYLDRKDFVRDGDELSRPFITPRELDGRTFRYRNPPLLTPIRVSGKDDIVQGAQALARKLEEEISGIEPPKEEPPPSYAEATANNDEENLPSGTSFDVSEVGSDEEEDEEEEDEETSRPPRKVCYGWDHMFLDGYDE